jgi:hypothetical protein
MVAALAAGCVTRGDGRAGDDDSADAVPAPDDDDPCWGEPRADGLSACQEGPWGWARNDGDAEACWMLSEACTNASGTGVVIDVVSGDCLPPGAVALMTTSGCARAEALDAVCGGPSSVRAGGLSWAVGHSACD